MTAADLRTAIVAPLMALAIAREYEARHPSLPARVPRDLCPDCGSSAREWPMWVSFTARCTGDWHRA